MTMEHRLLQHHQQQNTEMGTPPMPTPIPMGGTASPNPGAKQQAGTASCPSQNLRWKSTRFHPVISLANGQVRRPLSQPTSSRARVGGGNEPTGALCGSKGQTRSWQRRRRRRGTWKQKTEESWLRDSAGKCHHRRIQKNASTARRCRRWPLGITPIVHRDRSPHAAVSETTRSHTEPVRTDNKWRRR